MDEIAGYVSNWHCMRIAMLLRNDGSGVVLSISSSCLLMLGTAFMSPERPPEAALSYQILWGIFVDAIFASSRSHRLIGNQDDAYNI